MNRTIFFTAGGTGGHIFPALAVAKLFQAEHNIVWIGGKSGLENTIIPKHGIKLETISISGLRKKGLIKLALMPFILARACYQATKLIFVYRPDAIVGFGGYATFPLCFMGWFWRVPVLIHEQNAIPGLSNKILAKFATVVMTAYPTVLASKRTKVVGNPVREDICKILPPEIRYSQRTGGLNVLIVGGSLGAKIFNETFPLVFANTTNVATITHQVGRGDAQTVAAHYKSLGVNATVVDFIQDMAAVYAAADLIICRAGASTVSEIMAAGLASIFIPYPYAVDDHQYYNAKPLVDAGAAYLILQRDMSRDKLTDMIIGITRARCLEMADQARSLAIVDSSTRIYEIIRNEFYE